MRSLRPTRRASVAAVAALVLSALHAGAARADEPVAPLPPVDPAVSVPAPLPPPSPLPPPAPPPAVVIVEAPPPVVAAPSPAPIADAQPRDEAPDEARFRDAHADRVILGATAETHPKGTFFVTDYEVALLQIGYAVTDDLQISLAGVPPIAKDQPLFFDIGAKLNLVRTESTRVAVYGAIDVLTNARSNSDNSPEFAGRVGGVAQVCFERACRSSLSFGGGAIFGHNAEALPLYGAVGLIANVSPLVSLLAEPNIAGVAPGEGNTGGALLSIGYGVRLSGKNFGVDLTFIEPIAATSGSFENPFVLGYPFAAFTYRTDPSPRAATGAAARTAPVALPMVTRGM
jgi:hypothetical protein